MLRAEAAAEWARVRREQARQAKTNEDQMEHEVGARDLFAQAGAAYAEAADQAQDPAERADALWQSAAQYLACQDYARAAGQLEAFLRLGQQPDRQGEAFYLLGEAHRRSDHPAEAGAAYRECIKFPTHFAYRARYQLALAAIAAGDLDEAEAALSLNLKLLRFDPDPEALEKSLFALGDLLYQRRNYRMVVRRLEEALTRFQAEPAAPRSVDPPGPAAGQPPLTPEYTRARYQLADSYRQLAAQENQNYLIGDNMSGETRKHFLQEHRRWLLKAAEEFSRLDELLQNPQTQGHLRPDQQVRVPFIAARCWFNHGHYEKALKIYDDLARRYRKRPEALEALGGTVSCYAALGQLEQVRNRLDDIRRELPDMNEPVRRAWEAWIIEASKPLAVP
jgi:TolA-binding protein